MGYLSAWGDRENVGGKVGHGRARPSAQNQTDDSAQPPSNHGPWRGGTVPFERFSALATTHDRLIDQRDLARCTPDFRHYVCKRHSRRLDYMTA